MATLGVPTRRMDRTWVNVLSTVPVLAGLSKRHIVRIAELATERRVAAHSDIVRSGEIGDVFYVVLDGSVTVRRKGRKAVQLGVGEFFGEIALLNGGLRNATVVADTDTLLMAIARKDFLKVLAAEPKVAMAMLVTVANRLRPLQSSPND